MNEGLYREGPTAGGLPLPRAALGAFTGVVIAVSVLAAFVPWMLLFGKGPATAWMTFRNGGIGMWFLALLDFALPVALGIAGAVVVRGKRVPSGLFFGVAIVPLFVSILFAYLAHTKIEGAIAGLTIDPQFAMRINAAGMSEAFSLDQFGGFVTCGSALIGAVSLAAAVASIDVATATRSDGQRPSSVFGAATLVAGAAWLVATLVVTALRIRVVGPIAIWMLFIVALLVPLAVFAARAAPVLRGWHDPIEARRASGGLLVAGLAAMLAVIVFERAILARTASEVLGAVSGESVDRMQRVRILMELVEARKWANVAYGIHAVLGGATFALAASGSIGSRCPPRSARETTVASLGGGRCAPPGRHPISPSTVMAASVGVFVLAAAFALGVARARLTERVAKDGAQAAPKGITLPRVDASADEGLRGEGGAIILRPDGTNAGELTHDVGCGTRRSINVLADRMATIEMLAKKIPRTSCRIDLVFGAAIDKERVPDAQLGDLSPFVRGEIATLSLGYEQATPSYPSSGYLTVRSLEDETIEYEGNKVKLPFGSTSPHLRSARYEMVRYVFRPTDTIGHVLRVVVAMRERLRLQGLTLNSDSRVEIDWPPKPLGDLDELAPSLRLGTPVVSGPLPAEVITRIFRLNRLKLVKCHEEGLHNDPKLAGTVRVKLVINRAGTVSAAHAETPPRDGEVGKCMARAFYDVSFPKPEGGIVIVDYPIELGP